MRKITREQSNIITRTRESTGTSAAIFAQILHQWKKKCNNEHLRAFPLIIKLNYTFYIHHLTLLQCNFPNYLARAIYRSIEINITM